MSPRPTRDEARLRREFLAEAETLLEAAGSALEAVRAGGDDPSPEAVNRLFREVHSLKGVGAMVGLTGIAQAAHQLEALLDAFRMGRARADATGGAAARAGLTALAALVSAVAAGEADPQPDPALLDRLAEAALRQPPKEPSGPPSLDVPPDLDSLLTDYERHRLAENGRRGRRLALVALDLPLDTFDDGLRKGMAEAATAGELIGTFPGVPGGPSTIGFRLLVAAGPSASPAEVAARCGGHLEWTHPPEARTPPDRTAERPAPPRGDAEAAIALPSPTRGTVRVAMEKVERLVDLAGELALARGAVALALERALPSTSDRAARYELQRAFGHLDRAVTAVGKAALSTRLVPVDQLTSRLDRTARQLAIALGKQVSFQVFGGDTEIDKTLADDLGDPLLHLIRNALDHGIEPAAERREAGKSPEGRVTLSVAARGREVVFTLEDDGRGIDPSFILAHARSLGVLGPGDADPPDPLSLLFRPGFSTAARVSSVSGRGVGLDVVASNLAALKGRVAVRSEKGRGSVFEIVVPMTLVQLDVLLVRVGDASFALPTTSVARSAEPRPEDVALHDGRTCLREEGQASVPLVDLGTLLGLPNAAPAAAEGAVVVLEEGSLRAGLVVSSIEGTVEVLVKPLSESLPRAREVTGAAEIPGGGLALTLDAGALLARATGGGAFPLPETATA